MSDQRFDRYSSCLDRWKPLLRRFLAKLPASGWRGTIAELEGAVNVDVRAGEWPYFAQGLTRALNLAAAELAAAGWEVVRYRTAKERGLEFRRVRKAARKTAGA